MVVLVLALSLSVASPAAAQDDPDNAVFDRPVSVVVRELDRRAGCYQGNTIRVGIWPLDEASLPIPADSGQRLYLAILSRLLDDAPFCATIWDGDGVNATLDYLNRVGELRLVGSQSRAEIERNLQDVDYYVRLDLFEQGTQMRVSLKLVEIKSRATVATPESASVPQSYLDQACGAGAVPLDTALSQAARRLVNGAPELRAVTDLGAQREVSPFNDYVVGMLVDELIAVYGNMITDKALVVMDRPPLGDGSIGAFGPQETYRLQFENWPCVDSDRITFRVILKSGTGITVTTRGAAKTTGFAVQPSTTINKPEPAPVELKNNCELARTDWEFVEGVGDVAIVRSFIEEYAPCTLFVRVAEAKLAKLMQPDRANPQSAIDVVEAFYRALGDGDGHRAAQFVIPEKRGEGAYSEKGMSQFYGVLTERLKLLDVVRETNGSFLARYHFRSGDSVCDGRARVTVSLRSNRFLIEKIVALNGC